MNYNDKARNAIDPIHRIGRVTKGYGSEGEVVIKLGGEGGLSSRELISKVKEEPLWIEIDSIATPFFVLDAKSQGVGAVVVRFEFIDSKQSSSIVMGKEVFLESLERKRHKASDWGTLEGFEFRELTSGLTGTVLEVIENSLNTLLLIDIDGNEHFIPLAEELISSLNTKSKVISMTLVEGFFDSVN